LHCGNPIEVDLADLPAALRQVESKVEALVRRE